MSKKTIYKKLQEVQSALQVPKGQRNDFGKYNYRSAEDIMSAIKPYQEEQGLVTTVNCSIELLGDRYYVNALATITDVETGESISVGAQAREDESKKGMDASQITGSATSYARKYALAGLFAIDNEKDSDVTNKHGKAASGKKIDSLNAEILKELLKKLPKKDENAMLNHYGILSVDDLLDKDYAEALRTLEMKVKKL